MESDATPSAEMVASPRPEATQTPAAPSATPSAAAPVAEATPDLPVLRGTMVGTTTSAVLEYQGLTRVVKEGDAIGPFRVGGIYPKKASVAGEGHKYFLTLVPQTPTGAGVAPKREGGTDQWVNGLVVTQVVRDGAPIGLLIHHQGNPSPVNAQEGPLSQYGVYDNDVVKAVNGRPLRAQEDLWWLHEELLHSPNLEIAMERGGVDQTLRQSR